jgi:hypothetical protein
VHAAFGTVLWIVCGVAAVVAILALVMSSRAWSEFGRDGLVMDRDEPRPRSGGAVSIRERDEDIRSMLDARNARRVRRGETPLDVEHELARLTAPGATGGDVTGIGAPGPAGTDPTAAGADPAAARTVPTAAGADPAAGIDPELVQEIRQLVVARNARRTRAGKPPLDIDAELARELRRVSEGFG